jgi:hypothetical protein
MSRSLNEKTLKLWQSSGMIIAHAINREGESYRDLTGGGYAGIEKAQRAAR